MRRSRRPRSTAPLVLALVGSSVIPGSARAQESFADQPPRVSGDRSDEASEGALFLLLPVGAQGVAMGRAMTAIPTQESAFWNPAGLAGVDRSRFLFYRGDQLAGEATAFTLLLRSESVGTLGLSYQLLDVGDQDLTGDDGAVLGRVSVRSQQGVVSFATQFLDRVNAGVNFKVVQFRLDCRGQCLDAGVTATTYAVDAGIQSTPLDAIPLRLGAMVAHLGPRLQVVNAEQADPLPTRVRVSGAYDMLAHFAQDEPLDLWLTVELEDRWRSPGHPSVFIGTEFSAGRRDMIFVRAGYVNGDLDQTDGAALGLGLRYERFDLGIAKSLARAELTGDTEPVHVTLGVVF